MKANPESRSSAGDGETADSLKDLVETLTALGNYVGAVNRMLVGRLNDQVVGETLEKALRQHQRGISALVRLRASQPPSGEDLS